MFLVATPNKFVAMFREWRKLEIWRRFVIHLALRKFSTPSNRNFRCLKVISKSNYPQDVNSWNFADRLLVLLKRMKYLNERLIDCLNMMEFVKNKTFNLKAHKTHKVDIIHLQENLDPWEAPNWKLLIKIKI